MGAGGYGSPGEICFWDAASGNKVSELKGHSDVVNSVAWSPRAPCHTVHTVRVPFQLRHLVARGSIPDDQFRISTICITSPGDNLVPLKGA